MLSKLLLIYKIVKNIRDFLTPVISVWCVMAYILLMSYESFDERSRSVIALFFAPIVLFEFFASSLFRKDKPITLLPKDIMERYKLYGRIFFWLCIFIFCVYTIPENPGMREPFNLTLLPKALVVYASGYYFTYIALVIWISIYYYFTFIKRKIRIFVSLVLPSIFTVLIFYLFYFLGGVGNYSYKAVSRQQGVKIFYSGKDFPKKNEGHYELWAKANRFHPRDIYIDKRRNILFANYAKTFTLTNKTSAQQSPCILSIDLDTKQTKYFMGYYARAFSAKASTILLSPWIERKIYEINKDDLSLIRVIPAQTDVYAWETLNIYHDTQKDFIYITNDIIPVLFKYDYATGNLIDTFSPEAQKFGSLLWNLQVSRKTGLIYVIGLNSENNIYEIAPENLTVLRAINLHTPGGSTLLLDDENQILYFQDGARKKLYEVDIKTFKVKRILKGEPHARRMVLDRKRNALYINSFLFGKLTALDLNQGKQAWSIKVGGKPYGIFLSDDNNTLYVNSRVGIIEIDLNIIWKKFSKM